MLIAFSWSLVLILAAGFSLFVWLLHASVLWLLAGGAAMAPTLSSAPVIPVLSQWWAVWLPAEWVGAAQATATAVWPWIQSAAGALPALASWLTPLAWVVWGGGMVLLLGAGVLVHVLSRAVGRHVPSGAGKPAWQSAISQVFSHYASRKH